MPGPFDYTGQMGSPIQAFTQGLQVSGLATQQQVAQDRARQVQSALATLQQDRSPANVANVLMAFPELKDQITASQSALSEDQKSQNRNFFGQVLMLRQSGMNDRAEALIADRVNALKNTPGREAEAQAAQTMFDAYKASPKAADPTISLYLQATDPEFYKTIAASTDKTALQKDFDFIKSTFGPQAAAEFAQYGRGGVVSIPIGNGQTYVGPAALAPGATGWSEQGAQGGQAQQQVAPTASGPEQILSAAAGSKRITQAEANVIKQSLGPNGQSAFAKWMTDNSVKVVTRTGRAADGRRVVQYTDGTIEYAD